MRMVVTNEFGLAVCKHFGLDENMVLQDIKINTEVDSVFSTTLTIALTADDLIGIGQLMKEQKK